MREVLQTRNRAFGPNGVPTTSRQTSATRTDTTSKLPISLGSTNKRYEPSRGNGREAATRPNRDFRRPLSYLFSVRAVYVTVWPPHQSAFGKRLRIFFFSTYCNSYCVISQLPSR